MLYIGSCRYMHGYGWHSFPGRLHTTKEIILFLENIDDIKNVVNNNPSNLTNMIFGDIHHPEVIYTSNSFIDNIKNIKNIKKIILEISSRKICYYRDTPINYHYYNYYCSYDESLKKYDLKLHQLSDDEIDKDLDYIKLLAKKIFNEDIEIHVIPHLNLKIKSTNDYIEERNKFVILLENLCETKNIKVHDVGKYIESIDGESFLEDYMPDSTHYIKDDKVTDDEVRKYLIERIHD